MAEEVLAARANEILEGLQPRVGNYRIFKHRLYQHAGDTVVTDYDLRGATAAHVVKRDIPEMTIGFVVTLIAAPAVLWFFGDWCAIATGVVGLFFCWIMWIEGHYLHLVTSSGEEHHLFVPEELAGELDLLILRIMTLE